jgi:hypothetical protein
VPRLPEVILNVDQYPGDLLVREFGPRMVCTKCAWSALTSGRTERAAAARGADRSAMEKLSDEERRAHDVLARYPDGCDEAVLLADGLTIRQLAGLVIDGLAAGSVARVALDGRERSVVWMKITEVGRQAIADT